MKPLLDRVVVSFIALPHLFLNILTLFNGKSPIRRKWLTGLLLSFGLLVAGCSDAPSDDQQADSQAEQKEDDGEGGEDGEKKKEKAPIPVEVVAVTVGDIQQTYRTITTLEAESEAQVVARSTGLVEKIVVEEGDWVTKGQLLAQLDVDQLTLELQQIDATLNQLKNELKRQKELFDRKLGSSDALDRARFEYQSQQAQHKLAKLKLDYASIEAPINGIITERMVKDGNLIRDNDPLFNIVDLQSLKAVLYLPERELGRVKKGQAVLLNIDAFDNRLVQGEIERIRPLIDTETGTFKVLVKLDNSDHSLKAGMFGKVEVVFDVHENSLLMQQQAVITQDNRSHVFVVKEDKAIQTPVTIGFRHNGLVEILDGVEANDLVITTGQQILKHETKIEVVGQEDIAGNVIKTAGAATAAVNP